MSKNKSCSICGQRRPVTPIHEDAKAVVCPKCGHHEQLPNPLWAKLFYSLPLERQAEILEVDLKQLPPVPPEYRKPVQINRAATV